MNIVPSLVRPVAPLITILQIVQMMAGIGIMVYLYWAMEIKGLECAMESLNLKLGLVMYISYFVLFAVSTFISSLFNVPFETQDPTRDHSRALSSLGREEPASPGG